MYNSIKIRTRRLPGWSRKINAVAIASALAAIAALGFLSASAEKPENSMARNSKLLTDPPQFYSDFIYDAKVGGNLATSPDTVPIFSNSANECDERIPTIDPDGNYISLGEWRQARGEAHALCTANGTRVQLKLKGLIPKGVYTVWLAIFDSPGITSDFSTFVGLGALGAVDGSQNSFIASAKGEGELSVLQPAGDLSMFGEVTNCLLEEGEVVLWLAMHMDLQTHGGVPHPEGVNCTLAFPAAFSFKK